MNRFHGDFTAGAAARWSSVLFFLDLDGVFDCEALASRTRTPAESRAGAFALARLLGCAEHGTERRACPQLLPILQPPGGLAEFGSVFVDAVGRCEMALIDAAAADQLAAVREGIKGCRERFIDRGIATRSASIATRVRARRA